MRTRTRKEWYDLCIERGTSWEQVFDILRDWKEWDETENIPPVYAAMIKDGAMQCKHLERFIAQLNHKGGVLFQDIDSGRVFKILEVTGE